MAEHLSKVLLVCANNPKDELLHHSIFYKEFCKYGKINKVF